jgi:hypothetical protein
MFHGSYTVSTAGLEQHVIDKGFQFAGERAQVERIPLEPGALFNVSEEAGVYTKVLSDLGMIADPDKAGEVILGSMQNLHDTLVADRQPGDNAMVPYFAIDLADRDGAFEDAEAAFNGQLPNIPEISVYRQLYGRLTPEQLNRRSFAGEAVIKGWSARAMLLGGERQDAPGLLFTGRDMNSVEQIKAFKALRAQYEATHQRSVFGVLNVIEHLVIDAGIREKNEAWNENEPLLDAETFSRTPQAGDPETGMVKASGGDSWVPGVRSIGDQVYLGRSYGGGISDGGLRVSAGPKQS